MRLSALSLPLMLTSTVVSAHGGARHPARTHEHLKKREMERIGMEKRQRQAVTSSSSGADDDDGSVLGGLLRPGSSSTSSPATTAVSTRITTTTTSTTSSALQSVTISPSAASGAVVTASSAISSASGLSSAAVMNNTSSAISSATSASSIVTSAVASSSHAASSAADTENVVTVTTDPAGEVRYITTVLTAAPSASNAAATSDRATEKSGGGISTGAIIGISVAAGVLLLTLVGCAIWRMKRRGGDEDDAIRWPELNRHGDSDTHHALPARQTGQHGFETGLERSLSNSSSIFAPSSTHAGAHSLHSAPMMALNGSNFGAASSLEDYDEYDEKSVPPLPALPVLAHVASHPNQPTSPYGIEEDYSNMPPAVQMHHNPNAAYGGYDSEEEGRLGHGQQMGMVPSAPPSYHPHGY